jgi:hypothetical protein
MVRTTATTSLAFIFLAAFATLAEALADDPYPRPTPAFCEEMPPLAPGLGGTRDGIIGGDSSTGPTFPSVCKQAAAVHAVDVAASAMAGVVEFDLQ